MSYYLLINKYSVKSFFIVKILVYKPTARFGYVLHNVRGKHVTLHILIEFFMICIRSSTLQIFYFYYIINIKIKIKIIS